jgi:hypothetical protein
MANENSPNIPGLSIGYKCTKATSFSFGIWPSEPWLEAGETAKLVDMIVTDAQNPLYRINRDRDGAEKCVYRSTLLEYGEIEGANNSHGVRVLITVIQLQAVDYIGAE